MTPLIFDRRGDGLVRVPDEEIVDGNHYSALAGHQIEGEVALPIK
jgi:hypothetical protein